MQRIFNCLLCSTLLTTPCENSGDAFLYRCERCGLLKISGTAAAVLNNRRPTATTTTLDAVSHAARSWDRGDKALSVDSNTVARWFREAQLASPAEQEQNLILWLGSERGVEWDPAEERTVLHGELASIVGGRSVPSSMAYLVNHVDSAGLVENLDRSGRDDAGIFIIRLTFAGWKRFEELQRTTVESRTAFMAMAFGNEGTEIAYRECFVPAVEDAGFRLRRVDEDQGAGLIDDQLRIKIRTSKFIVADLSDGNRGAYWEAGFAEGLGKPVIYACEETVFQDPDRRPHFDANHLVTVLWSPNDLTAARQKLTATIQNTFPTEARMTIA